MVKKLMLNNGLRVLLVPQKGAKTVTVVALVNAGSKYETKEENGISHFLEHMMFKGTAKRPSSLAIATELDRIGGESSAFTSHEYTGYWVKADVSHFELALEVISDIFQNSLYDPQEIEKEKGVVIEEVNMYSDIPMRYVGDLWMELLYSDQPAGLPIGGKKETIEKFTRDAVVCYVTDHYVAAKTIVVIAGDFDESVAGTVEKYFGTVRGGEGKEKPSVKESQPQPRSLVFHKKTDQTHFVLGVRAFSMFDERRFPLSLLGTILGGSMSSRLFQRLRDEMGVAYYVRSGADLFTDHGYFEASCGADNRRVGEVLKVILEEFERVKREPVGKEELQKVKDLQRGSLILNTETTDELAMYYGPQELLRGETMTPEEHIAKIQAVTPEDIQRVANDILKSESLNLALIGPFEEKEQFDKLLTLS